MFIMRFTERAYVNYSEEDVRSSFRNSVRLTFPNTYFNPELGADLYNEYLDEYEFSEEAGFDGLMLNEHHNTPTCMGAAMNLEAAILARITKKSKIVLLGNPLPIFDNPIRLAEELAEIDMISRGRLVSGFVRGTGSKAGRPTLIRCTIGNASRRRTISSSRPGRRPDLFDGKASTISFASSTLSSVRCSDRIRLSGFQAWAVRRLWNGAHAITTRISIWRPIRRSRCR